MNRASETDASQSGFEPGTSCTAVKHSMQRAIRTALKTTIRNLNLYYYSSFSSLKGAGRSNLRRLHENCITSGQSCWRNERLMNRARLGINEAFFCDSCSNLEIDEAFQISHNSDSISRSHFPKANSSARSISRNIHPPCAVKAFLYCPTMN